MAFSQEDILAEFDDARMMGRRPVDDTEIEFRLIQRAEVERIKRVEYDRDHRALMSLSKEWKKQQVERWRRWKMDNLKKRLDYQHEYNRRAAVKLKEKERNKRRRDAAKANGLCRYCMQKPHSANMASCSGCYKKYWMSPAKKAHNNALERTRRKKTRDELRRLRLEKAKSSAVNRSAIDTGSKLRAEAAVSVPAGPDVMVPAPRTMRIVRRHGPGQERNDADVGQACG